MQLANGLKYKLTRNSTDSDRVSASISDWATHGKSWVLLCLQPNSGWSNVFSVPTFVAFNASIHCFDTSHLVRVVRFVISGDHFGEPSLVVLLNCQGLTLNLGVLYLIKATLQWSNHSARVASICSHNPVALNHCSYYGSAWEFKSVSLISQIAVILGKPFNENIVQLWSLLK